jgi:hypothetical protein
MKFNRDEDAIKAGTSEFTITLHEAAYNGWYGTTKLLLDANADVDEWMDTGDSYVTLLHLATYRGRNWLGCGDLEMSSACPV